MYICRLQIKWGFNKKNPECKKTTAGTKCKWMDITRNDAQKIDVEWIHVAQNMDAWLVLVNMTTN
jgi:hypothetical protein